MRKVTTLETDVLVLGGGLAALRAAVAAASEARVVIAVKGKLGRSGSSAMTTAGYAAEFPPPDATRPDAEDLQRHIEDTMRGGYELNDPELVRILVEESFDRLRDLQTYGAQLLLDDAGLPMRSPSGDHSVSRVVSPVNRVGTDFTIPLADTATALGAEVLESVVAAELLLDGGSVCGAICIHMRTAEVTVVRARTTVLATGGAGQLFEITSNPAGSTGDGFAMALEAGAILRDMEMIQFYPWRCIDPFDRSRMPFQPSTFVAGATLHNRSGERFMVTYNPDGAEKSTRDIGARGIYEQIRKGLDVGGGVRCDLSALDEETFRRTNPKVWKALQKTDIDYRTYPFILTPEAHYVMGGLVIDADTATTLPGLFAAGEVAGGIQGANRLNSNALPETQVFGQRAGAAAASAAAARTPAGTADPERVALWQRRASACEPGRASRLTEERRTLQQVAWRTLGIERDREGLDEGAAYVRALRDRLDELEPTTALELVDWIETRSMCTFALASYASAIHRTETRGAHVRTDHPHTDTTRWRCAVTVELRGSDGPIVSTAPTTGRGTAVSA